MKNNRISNLILISLLITFCYGQNELNFYSQLNEQRTINLADYFGTITGNFKVASSPDAEFDLVQPLDFRQDPQFFASSRFEISSDSLEVDQFKTQQLQAFKDLANTPESQEQDTVYLSLILIDSTSGSAKITEIGFTNLSNQIGGKDYKVNLISESKGIIFYQKEQINYVRVVTLQGGNNLVLDDPVQLFGLWEEFIAINSQDANTVNLILSETQSNRIEYQQFNLYTKTVKKIAWDTVCKNFYGTQVQVLTPYLFQCVDYGLSKISFIYYFIDESASQLASISSIKMDYQVEKEIESVNVFNQKVYIMTTLSSALNFIQLTELNINQNNLIIDAQTYDIQIPVYTSSLYGYYINEQGFITLISSNYIIAINNYSDVILQINNHPADFSQVFQSLAYGNEIVIQYQTLTVFSAEIISTNLPTLTIKQVSDKIQSYTVSYQNNLLQKSINLYFNLISDDNMLIIQQNQDMNILRILNTNSSQIQINLDNFLIGYIKDANINTQQLQTINESKELVKDSSPIIKDSQLSVQKELFKFNYNKQVDQVYSTSNSFFLLVSQNQQPACTVVLSAFSISQPTVLTLANVNVKQGILNVDKSGFFSSLNDDGSSIDVYVFYNQNSQIKMYSFNKIKAVCTKDKNFQFSGNNNSNQLVVLCDKTITLYNFNQQNVMYQSFTAISYVLNYPVNQITSTITQLQLRSNGILYLVDSTKISIFDINANIFNGFVKLPSNINQSKIFIFYTSFIIVTNDQTPKVVQYSYNNFDGSDATILRQLLTFGYNWLLNPDLSGISQILNDNQDSYDQEFLIINSDNNDSSKQKLFYKINGIQAQNQLLTSYIVDNNTPFFAIPNRFGYIQDTNFVVNQLNYNIFLKFTLEIDDQQFQNNINGIVSGEIQVNTKQTFTINLNYYRNVNTSKSQVIDSESLQDFKGYFQNKVIEAPFNYYFDDRQFTNGHLFGWVNGVYDTSFSLMMYFNQRVNSTSYANKQDQLPAVINSLEVMPDVVMYQTANGIMIQDQVVSNQKQDKCEIYKQDGEVQKDIVDGNQVIKQIVYTLTASYSSIYHNVLTQYTYQATYPKNQNQNIIKDNDDVPAKPTVQLLDSQEYSLNSNIFDSSSIKTITLDSNLGLIALLQIDGVSSTKVCKLQLDQNKKQFSFDCDSYSSLNTLFITEILYISSSKQNIFVSLQDTFYYGFNSDLSVFQQINFKTAIIQQGKSLDPSSQVNYVKKIDSSRIIVSYANDNLFILQLDFNKQITINNNINTLYQQYGQQFIGSAILITNTQYLVFFQNTSSPANYFLCLYEQQNNNNDYLIRSSYRFESKSLVQQINMYYYRGLPLISVRYINNALFQPIPLQIAEQPQMNITMLKYNFNSDGTAQDLKFSIMPLHQANYENYIFLVTKVKTNITPTTDSLILKSVLTIMLLILLF